MPLNTRGNIKRQLKYTVIDLRAAQAALVKGGMEFEAAHPEKYESFCNLVSMVELLITTTEQLESTI